MDFIQLTKVAEDQQIIYARAICEEPDRSGQVADYLASKAAFQKWSSETSTASMGKSLGNIRVMHKPDVAGRVIDIQYDDINKAIDVAIQVDRPDVWKMCKVGAYTGLSVGGSYGKKWADPQYPGMERYEPRLSELSIVDRPCVPSATFQLLKADGQVEERHFANVAFDADIISTLKTLVTEHNESHPNEWAKAKLSDLKKVYKRGGIDSLVKADGNPMFDGISRVQNFLSALGAEITECDDKDLLNKNHPLIVSGGNTLRKQNNGYINPNSTGSKVGAATAAAVTGASVGYAARAAGKVLAVPTAASMRVSPRFRRAVNTGDDAMTATKRGIKNTARTGSIRAGLKTTARTFKALQNGTIHGKGILGAISKYRGAGSVPAAALGTAAGVLTSIHSYRSRRNAQRMNADIHNAIVGVQKMEKALIPGAKAFEIGGLAASTALGGIAGGIAAYKGNPYRDKDGKFTNKAAAAFVIGTGITAGAAAGFGGGLAITHRGLSQVYAKAQHVASEQIANYAAGHATLTDRGVHHFKLNEAVKNVRQQAKSEFDALNDTHSAAELNAAHNPYRSMAEDELLSSKNSGRDALLHPSSGKPNADGKRAVNAHAIMLRQTHEKLRSTETGTRNDLARASIGAESKGKAAEIEAAAKAHESAHKALADFEEKLAPYEAVAQKGLNGATAYASKQRTILQQRMVDQMQIGGQSHSWSDLYKQSAKLRAEGVKNKDVPYIVREFRAKHEKAFVAEHARLLQESERNFKAKGRTGPSSGTDRFKRVEQFSVDRLDRARKNADNLKRAKENLLGAKVAAQMHRMTSSMADASRPMRNEADAAIRIARHALTPSNGLKGIYAGTKRRVANSVKRIAFRLDGTKDAQGNLGYHKEKTFIGDMPSLDKIKLGAVAAGVAAGGTFIYRDDKKKWHVARPKDIRPHAHLTDLDNWHLSVTVPTRSNPNNRIYLGGLQARPGSMAPKLLIPGKTAFSSDYNSQQGGGNNQQQSQRQIPPVSLEGDDYKALNGWRGLVGQNQGLAVKKSEYGTQYRNHNLRNLSQEQMTQANNGTNAMKKTVERAINASKVDGKISRDNFLPLVRKITGAEPIEAGNEKYVASSLTARDQANYIKRMFPQSAGLNVQDPFSDAGKKATATALMNVVNKPYSDGGIPNVNESSDANAIKGAIHTFEAGGFISGEDARRIMGSVDARAGRDRNPGQKKTTDYKAEDYKSSGNVDFDRTVEVLSQKHPDVPKMVISDQLDKHMTRSRREYPEYDEKDHLTEAYNNTLARLDKLYND